MGFDGSLLDASKCPQTPSEHMFARRAKDPVRRSGQDYPAVRLDPKATHINTNRHHTKHLV